MKPIPHSRLHPIAMLALPALISASISASAQTVEVDPAGPIPDGYTLQRAWEFNTAGNAEGWSGTNLGTITVADGFATGTITTDDSQFSNNFASTPLSLGYATIIEYGLKVDRLNAASTGGTFFWGDFSGGISGARALAVPAIDNNTMRVVRVTFRGGIKNLSQLRLDPASAGFPKTASFDYVRVYHYQPTTFNNVTLTASDASGSSSINSAGGWNNLALPSTENNYFTGAFQLRTPGGTGHFPFGGSALSVDAGGSLLFKNSGGLLVRQITLAGGSLIQGATAATPDTARLFAPDGILVAAASTVDLVGATRNLEVTGPISGTASLNVKSAAAGASQNPGMLVLKSDNSGYTGTLTVEPNAWVDLDHDNAAANANVVVTAGGQVRRTGADADDTTAAASWAISGRGPTAGNEATRGAVYFGRDGLSATLAGPITLSGTQGRIGMYSGAGTLTLAGGITGTGTLELWGGGGAEEHVQRFILSGVATHAGQTDLLAEFGSQTHLRLGGTNRLPTGRRLRMSATWGSSAEGAGAFLDLNGFNQTLDSLQLDGTKRKYIHNTSVSGTSTLTLNAAVGGFDTNGGNVYIENVTITHGPTTQDSGAQLDGGSVVKLTNSRWNGPFYMSLGNGGSGALLLTSGSTLSFGGELLMARNGQTGTLTVDATSSATTPNFLRIGDSPAGVATVNLNGGLLAARSFRNESTGGSFLNLDGGTLRATGSNIVDWIEGGEAGVTTRIRAGGVTLDTNGFEVNATAALLEESTSPGGGVTKTGAGSLTLSGNSSYTGATSVQAGTLRINGDNTSATGAVNVAAGARLGGSGTLGGAVTMQPGSQLAWTITNWTAAPTLTVPSFSHTGNLSNPLVIVIGENALADFTETNATFTVLRATGAFTPGAVAVDASGFTSGTGTWAAQVSGNEIRVTYTTGSATTSAYDRWATSNGYWTPGTPNTLPTDDFDGDGTSNLAEFAFAGNPVSSSSSGLRHFQANAGKFVLTLAVRQGAAAGFPSSGAPLTTTLDGVIYSIQGSRNLSTFGEAVAKHGSIVLGPLNATPPSGYEYVTFELSDPVAANAKGFLRATAATAP